MSQPPELQEINVCCLINVCSFPHNVRFLKLHVSPLLKSFPDDSDGANPLTMSGNHGCPLCGTSFWETSIHLGESWLPQKSLSAFFFPEAFCNFTQSSFSFCHTIILCTCQYESIHHVVMGFGCVTSDSPTGPRAPRR